MELGLNLGYWGARPSTDMEMVTVRRRDGSDMDTAAGLVAACDARQACLLRGTCTTTPKRGQKTLRKRPNEHATVVSWLEGDVVHVRSPTDGEVIVSITRQRLNPRGHPTRVWLRPGREIP